MEDGTTAGMLNLWPGNNTRARDWIVDHHHMRYVCKISFLVDYLHLFAAHTTGQEANCQAPSNGYVCTEAPLWSVTSLHKSRTVLHCQANSCLHYCAQHVTSPSPDGHVV